MNETFSFVMPLAFECLREAVQYYRIHQKFTEDHLDSLFDFYGNIFEGAIELLENYKITQYQTEDGLSKVYKVGNKKEQYTVYENINFCYCPVFRYQVLELHNCLTCKHILAVTVADAMGIVIKEIVTPSQMVEFLNGQLNHIIE
ncbi:hypothetical protein WA026_016689 [Henosepilachna vigintioctopunctata]|uniref:SWIM-type domain-containing protein n=1 Tax=Henosepilachna vigintioctopunctata TaxID=420089 RepID=A0AAW1UZ11_9CUCU